MKKGKQTLAPGLYRSAAGWTVRVQRRVTTPSGSVTIERTRRLGPVSETEALAALVSVREAVEAEAERRERGATAPGTLGDYAPRWLQLLVERERVRPAVVDTRTRHLERFVLPFFGHMDATAIRPRDIEAWKGWLAERRQPERHGNRVNHHAGEPYSHDTLLGAWATLRAFMRWVAIEADLPANPMRDCRFDVRAPKGEPKAVLTAAELARLLEAAKTACSPDWRTMMVVGFGTGARFSELSAMEWRDLDLAKGTWRIERSQVGGVVGRPKTESSRRLVYLAPEVTEALHAHRRWQMTERAHRLVFPTVTGRYRQPQTMRKPLRAAAEAAGIQKRLSAHCMRKTANNLLRRIDPMAARAMLGHATEEMTYLYSEVDIDERAATHRAAFGDALKA